MADDATTYNVLDMKATCDAMAQQLDVFARTLEQYRAAHAELKDKVVALAAQCAIDLEPASSPAAASVPSEPAASPTPPPAPLVQRASSGGASRGSRGAGASGKDED